MPSAGPVSTASRSVRPVNRSEKTNPRPPRDSNPLRAYPSLESRRMHEPKRAPTKCVLDKFQLGGIVDAFRNTPDGPPAVELPGLDADQTESPGVLNDDILASHRLTALETKLLHALQDVLLNEARMLEAIQRYIPTARTKKAATARRESRSRRTWQIPATTCSDRSPGAATNSGIYRLGAIASALCQFSPSICRSHLSAMGPLPPLMNCPADIVT